MINGNEEKRRLNAKSEMRATAQQVPPDETEEHLRKRTWTQWQNGYLKKHV